MGGLARLKLLLDTHIWLWSLQDTNRLGKRVRQELADAVNERWLSPISTWEALTLHFKGRVVLLPNLPVWVADATRNFREAPLTHQITVVAQIPLASPGSCGPSSSGHRQGSQSYPGHSRQNVVGIVRNLYPRQSLARKPASPSFTSPPS